MPIEMQRRKEQDLSIAGRFEMRRRAPPPALDGIVSDVCGYRETAPGHFRNIEYASLTVPLVISFAEPFAIGLGKHPGDNDRFASFAAGLFAGPVIIESFGAACCVQINFTPLGARRFFGLPMSELTDSMVVLDDVLGAEGMALRERLGNAPDSAARFRGMSALFRPPSTYAKSWTAQSMWLPSPGHRDQRTGGARDASVGESGSSGLRRELLVGRVGDRVGAGSGLPPEPGRP